jgi:uncharacterized membrane protein (UPF0127 family)
MAARPTNPGSSMRFVIIILGSLLGIALVGVTLWLLWPRPATDYCKELSTDTQFQTTAGYCHMKAKEIKLINDAGAALSLIVRMADEPDEQTAGFQKIGEKIIAQNQILFVFPQEIQESFHMCNVRAPLDIAWIGADGTLLDVQTLEPGPETTETCPIRYTASGNSVYMYALEAASGFFSKNSITKEKSRLLVESLR